MTEDPELIPVKRNPLERAHLQSARMAAYNDGEYELKDYEGFSCPDCGWRGLSAPMADETDVSDDNFVITQCAACGRDSPEISDQETDWDDIEDRIPDEYLTGEAMETNYPECDICGRDMLDGDDVEKVIRATPDGEESVPVVLNDTEVGEVEGEDVTVGESIEAHTRCVDSLWFENIENKYWYDTFTDAHYWTAAEFLSEFDSIGHVITSDFLRQMGEMYVHTNYASTAIVGDVIDHYNGRLCDAGVVHEDDEHQHRCVSEHGTCFEIFIDFCSDTFWRAPPEELYRLFHEKDIKTEDYFVKEEDKIFDADFSEF